MLEIPATEFIRKFRQYNLEAQREPVAVTNHGKVDGYYVSAIEYDELQKAKAAMRRSYTLKTLPDHLYTAIIEAKVDPSYAHLDELLNNDKSPAAAG
jgi:prevent-host-death family protein